MTFPNKKVDARIFDSYSPVPKDFFLLCEPRNSRLKTIFCQIWQVGRQGLSRCTQFEPNSEESV